MPETERSAFVAIVGRPNVGKSSLLNTLLGGKLAIVSDKPQTTRKKLLGVLTNGPVQLVFLDTPGLHTPHTKLGEYMVGQVRESMDDVDVVLLVTDVRGEISRDEEVLIGQIKERGLPAALVINKIDLLEDKTALLALIAKFSAAHDFDAVFPISVKENDGVDDIVPFLEKNASDTPHFFPDDTLTDQPERLIASELLRESILHNTFEEIPHGVAVEIERFHEREDSSCLDIHATIYCEKASHKGMLIGKGGQMLKRIGTDARQSMESFFDCKVNLQCWVKVSSDWRNDERSLRKLGYSE